MSSKFAHRLIAPVIATLTVVVSVFWIGQAISGEQTVTVYKNPT